MPVYKFHALALTYVLRVCSLDLFKATGISLTDIGEDVRYALTTKMRSEPGYELWLHSSERETIDAWLLQHCWLEHTEAL